jgi:FkbM family methyltransferase
MHGVAAQRTFIGRVLFHCKNFRTAIDCGAHIGTWSVYLARRFKVVWAIEAAQENFYLLEENTEHLDNIRRRYGAVGREVGTCRMILPENQNSGCWYAKDSGDVPVTILDVIGAKSVDLIKLDIEGSEGFALLGATGILARDHPVVVFEDNGLGRKHYGESWIDPKDVLTEFGYRKAQRYAKDEIWI